MKIIFIVGFIALFYMMVTEWFDQSNPHQHQRAPPQYIKQLMNQRRQIKKQVRFRPTVRVTSAGGRKTDRFNPEFRPTVARNTNLAARVGGARKLAHLSLLEAASASSTSSEE